MQLQHAKDWEIFPSFLKAVRCSSSVYSMTQLHTKYCKYCTTTV